MGSVVNLIEVQLVGASVSEPLTSDLNVNFVCLSVRLSVMDSPLTVNHFWTFFCALCVMRYSNTSQELNA